MRCWLLELIAEAHSTRALPLLTEQLHHSDPGLRDRAKTGVQKLDTPEARTVLYQAHANDT